MRSFRITFVHNGCEHTRLFLAASVNAALALAAKQYPGSHVWSVEEI